MYEEVERPKGKRIISMKWVLRIKKDQDGIVEKLKARVVARGFKQMEGVDYEETFAPTVRHERIRALISFGASDNWEFDQMDVTTAFLYADLEEEV